METHDLYGLPLERFVPERTALTKSLRAEGKRDEAARVAKLRKPSVAAWAVNQLVRTQTRAAKELFEAGDALQHAQDELLARRGDAQALREAGERERRAVDDLTAAARGLLSAEGHELTQTTLDRVTSTLHAAAFDPEARAQVSNGCLDKELRHVGLGGGGLGGGLVAPPAAPPKREPRAGATKRGATRTTSKAESKRAAEAERAERERAAKARDAARRTEAEARRRAARAARDLVRAEALRDRAAEALQEAQEDLQDAEEAVGDARQRAEAAAQAHQEAQEALERL